MSDLAINHLKFQGKKARAIYNYKATMNDELNLKIDDIIVITQCSEDETWLEGTLNGLTGWFPSNYVQVFDDEHPVEQNLINEQTEPISQHNDNQINSNINTQPDENLRIKYLNELKRTEESFLDEMCKFVKIALIPLQTNGEVLPIILSQQINSSVDEVIRCHQTFYKQLKEIPDDSDAKIGHLLISLAPQFKSVYDSYARTNPKYSNAIAKKKEALSKFFETSLSKMSSPLLPITSSMTVSVYITKFLAAPFKQLEMYVKILKEIQRFTEDFHVDRGDTQRCIEFYSDLTNNVFETRKRKEYEFDIFSSRINNMDEDLIRNNDCLFLSPVLLINENGEKDDRIMLLFQNYLVILSQNMFTHEFSFEFRIPFLSTNTNQALQIKKITNFESLNNSYDGVLNGATPITNYCFELTSIQCLSPTLNPNINSLTRLLVVCNSSYDMKMWVDCISNLVSKVQFALNNKSLTRSKTPTHHSTSNNISSSNLAKHQDQHKLTLTKSPLSNSTNLQSQQQVKLNKSISPSTTFSNSVSNPQLVTSQQTGRRVFSLRPHPPLIPHFQLPQDAQSANSNDPNSLTLKRFMYKKPKLSEPFGKYHGADDDLKLLNVIESFCKTKLRQSVNVNANSNESGALSNKSTVHSVPQPQRVHDADHASASAQNDKYINKYLNKLVEDKIRLESNMQSISEELNETKKSNRELKMFISNLQKQLESEKSSRRKLESYVRKQMKPNGNQPNEHHIMMNIEHESSI